MINLENIKHIKEKIINVIFNHKIHIILECYFNCCNFYLQINMFFIYQF